MRASLWNKYAAVEHGRLAVTLERQVVTDPKGRQWSVALMDVLGQEGDPDMPSKLLELQYSSGRYFTLIYSATGALQRERGYASLAGSDERLRAT